jgi:hypothetical protein
MFAITNMPLTANGEEKGASAPQWPTQADSANLQIFRSYGLTSGSVVLDSRTYEQWGEDSSVTWQFANNLSGQYKGTLTYRSSRDVAYTFSVGDEVFEGVIEKGEGVLKHPLPPVTLERIGVHPITLSISADDPDNDFELTDLRLKFIEDDVVMSKPVLIAGGDWVKVQGSLVLKSDAIAASDLEIHATITPWPEGDVLWEGSLSAKAVAGGLEIDATVSGLKAKRWSPDTPYLYQIALEVRGEQKTRPWHRSVSRFGFRDFETKDGRFYLNGEAIFLRGNSIMPPGWGNVRGLNPDVGNDPAEIRKYIKKMQAFNVNLIRVHDPVWLSLCDELGMMVFTGRYGVPKWGGAKRYAPPAFKEEAATYYKQLFAENYMNHPSVVIWVLTNEMPSAMSEVGHQYIIFLRQVFDRLSKWDPTRAYIDNAGFGLGQATDINDLHVYVGWYNGIVQSLYKFREDLRGLGGLDTTVEPLTFTEMIGAYTDTLGRMPAHGKMVAASLMWAGNDSDVPEYALEYQNYLTQNFIEILRRMRSVNPDIAGTMPFTTTANGWENVNSVEEIDFKPHMKEGLTTAYQPVLLSFENWRPHVFAGDELQVTAHLVNDAEDSRKLSKPGLHWRLVHEATGKTVDSGEVSFGRTLKHYAVVQKQLKLEIDLSLQEGQYLLKGDVVEKGKTISTNEAPIWVGQRDYEPLDTYRKVTLFDPLNETRPILEKAGLVEGRDFFMTSSPFSGMRQFDKLSGSQLQETLGVEGMSSETVVAPSRSVMIIGSKLWVEPLRDKYLLVKEFIDRGGRVLFLHPNAHALNDIGIFKEIMVQENEWIGDHASVAMESIWHTSRIFGTWINPRRSDTEIFDSIERDQLWLWSDSSNWNPSQPGLPEFEPVSTLMKVRDTEALNSTAVLADFGRGLEYVALAEVFRGEGSVILSGFDFDRFVGFDPIADKVLRRIIEYVGDGENHYIVPEAKMTTNLGSPSDEDGILHSEFQNGLLMEYHTNYEAPYFTGFQNADYQVRRIMGPFWFNRLCHTKPINPDEPIRSGFLHVRPPEGVTEVIFHVRRVPTRENKGSFDPASVKISIGEDSVVTEVPGEDEVEVRIALPKDSAGPFKVEFEGLNDMGISTMRFQ